MTKGGGQRQSGQRTTLYTDEDWIWLKNYFRPVEITVIWHDDIKKIVVGYMNGNHRRRDISFRAQPGNLHAVSRQNPSR